MGIPKKGSRKIIIDDASYCYKVRGNDGYIDLIIEKDSFQGQRLTVSFDYNYEEKEITSDLDEKKKSYIQINQITPKIVKEVVLYGIQNGWTPNEKGKEIRINFVDNQLR